MLTAVTWGTKCEVFSARANMAGLGARGGLTRVLRLSDTLRRSMHTSTSVLAGRDWRLRQGLGECGNEYGPLTDIPDWSYADGRPAPPTQAQLRRREQQIEMCERIVKLTKEVKFAKENYQLKLNKVRQQREQVMSRKLRPKVTD